jgi:hypothetical protein
MWFDDFYLCLYPEPKKITRFDESWALVTDGQDLDMSLNSSGNGL